MNWVLSHKNKLMSKSTGTAAIILVCYFTSGKFWIKEYASFIKLFSILKTNNGGSGVFSAVTNRSKGSFRPITSLSPTQLDRGTTFEPQPRDVNFCLKWRVPKISGKNSGKILLAVMKISTDYDSNVQFNILSRFSEITAKYKSTLSSYLSCFVNQTWLVWHFSFFTSNMIRNLLILLFLWI